MWRPWARPARPSSKPRSRRSAPRACTRARISTSSRSGSPMPAPCTGDSSTTGSWAASSWRTRSPTIRRWSTACSSAPPRSRPRPRSRSSPRSCATSCVAGRRSRSRRAPVSATATRRQPRVRADERHRPEAPADPVRAWPTGPRWRQDPASAQGRVGPDPGGRPPGRPAGSPRAQRAGGRAPLRQPLATELRGGHRLLSARFVHDEVQSQAQRVGGPAARLRVAPPPGAR